eukprot:TRINITY_DN5121_c0_g1_i1.p1 TRINITY_DN5121_c0_g1~~TRINITY_DN5121_c0_g1_i1.p1  ORF type:complete len:609 (-),score=201.09 TRINITY_DN5121_c0_g1_i1:65-1891(-)
MSNYIDQITKRDLPAEIEKREQVERQLEIEQQQSRDLTDQVGQLDADLRQEREARAQMTQEIDEAQKRWAEEQQSMGDYISQLRPQAQQLPLEVAKRERTERQLEQQSADLQQERARLREVLDQIRQAHTELQQLGSQLESETTGKSQAVAALEIARREWEQERQEMTVAKSQAVTQLEIARREWDQERQALTAAESQAVTNLDVARREWEQERQAMTEAESQAVGELESARREWEQERRGLTEAKSQATSDLEIARREWEQEREAMTASIQQIDLVLRPELDRALRELRDEIAKRENAERRADVQSLDLERKDGEIKELHANLMRLTTSMQVGTQALEDRIAGLSEDLAHMDSQLQQETSKFAALEQQLLEAQRQQQQQEVLAKERPPIPTLLVTEPSICSEDTETSTETETDTDTDTEETHQQQQQKQQQQYHTADEVVDPQKDETEEAPSNPGNKKPKVTETDEEKEKEKEKENDDDSRALSSAPSSPDHQQHPQHANNSSLNRELNAAHEYIITLEAQIAELKAQNIADLLELKELITSMAAGIEADKQNAMSLQHSSASLVAKAEEAESQLHWAEAARRAAELQAEELQEQVDLLTLQLTTAG